MHSYNEQMKFTKAVIYNLTNMEIPIPFHDSTGGPFKTIPMPQWLVLYDENGICGQSPCTKLMKDVFIPLIMTGETKTYEQWYHTLHWHIRNSGFSGELSVELGRLDLAFHDILAKRVNKPIHKFWGATRDWADVYASGLGTSLTEKQTAVEVEDYLKRGYTTIKMKVATNFAAQLDKDIERVKLIRGIIGKNAKLAIDANQLFTADEALDFANKVAEYDIAWYEEPVHSHDMLGVEKLIKATSMQIAMGESMRNHYPYMVYIEKGVKHLQPVPSNLSSVRDWFKVRDMAQSNNILLSSGGFSPITASYMATASENNSIVEFLTPIMRPFYDLMDIRPEEKDGKFFLPGEAGIPVRLDFKLLDKINAIESIEYFTPAI